MVSYVAETHCWQRKQKRIRISLVSQEKRQMVWSAEDAYARGQNVTLAGGHFVYYFHCCHCYSCYITPPWLLHSIFDYFIFARPLEAHSTVKRMQWRHFSLWTTSNIPTECIFECYPRLWVEILDTLDRTWIVIETFSWYFSVGRRTYCSIMVLFLFTTLGTVSSFHFIKSTWISPNPLIDRISNQMHWIVY